MNVFSSLCGWSNGTALKLSPHVFLLVGPLSWGKVASIWFELLRFKYIKPLQTTEAGRTTNIYLPRVLNGAVSESWASRGGCQIRNDELMYYVFKTVILWPKLWYVWSEGKLPSVVVVMLGVGALFCLAVAGNGGAFACLSGIKKKTHKKKKSGARKWQRYPMGGLSKIIFSFTTGPPTYGK